ncbi:MAG TPA: hypothetical protein ENI70_00735 [Candidatus Peregrinibacteria bacterium]|nr:hypothetical protein [Candidatus Peregrinibacteria bacterium]
MKKVLIIGNYGVGNLGDEAILSGALRLCKNLHYSPRVLSHNPALIRKEYQVEASHLLPFGFRSFFKGNFLKTIKAFRETDLVILGGGGLFVGKHPLAIPLWAWHAFWAVIFKKNLYLCGQSFGELKSFWQKKVVRWVAQKAKKITVRDKTSASLLADLGINEEKISIFPDFAFNLQFRGGIHPKKGETIAFALCKWGMKEKQKQEIIKTIDLLTDRGYKISLLPFQSFADNDFLVLGKIFSQLLRKDQVFLPSKPLNLEELIEQLKTSDLVVGMRLHSLILGAALGKPVLGIAYQEKVRNFMSDLEIDEYCLSLQEIEANKLLDMIDKIISQKSFFQDKFAKIKEKYSNQFQNYKNIFS